MKKLAPKFFSHNINPITEEGIYELKWMCQCCGSTGRTVTPIYIDDGEACYPCECGDPPQPHFRPMTKHCYYRRIE